jgi:hypothetical protein
MGRFFFHTEDGRSVSDEDGTELESIEAARVEAVRVFGDMLREDPGEILASGRFRLTVTDAEGRIHFALDLSTADAGSDQARRSGG